MKRERNINYRAAEYQPREADDRIKMTKYVHTLKVVLVWYSFEIIGQRWIKTHLLHHMQSILEIMRPTWLKADLIRRINALLIPHIIE